MTRVDEGGFGRETYTGGVDKLSHAYSFYIGTRLVSDALQWGGASKTEAMVTSVLANAGTSYLIELFDGYSKKTYGFSREDLVADAVGIIMGTAVNAFPDLDRKFAYRMRYYPKGAGGSANFIDSYEGQTYFLTARLSGFANLSPKILCAIWSSFLATGVPASSRAREFPASTTRAMSAVPITA